jgi:hypothetical protein
MGRFAEIRGWRRSPRRERICWMPAVISLSAFLLFGGLCPHVAALMSINDHFCPRGSPIWDSGFPPIQSSSRQWFPYGVRVRSEFRVEFPDDYI